MKLMVIMNVVWLAAWPQALGRCEEAGMSEVTTAKQQNLLTTLTAACANGRVYLERGGGCEEPLPLATD